MGTFFEDEVPKRLLKLWAGGTKFPEPVLLRDELARLSQDKQ